MRKNTAVPLLLWAVFETVAVVLVIFLWAGGTIVSKKRK